MTTWTWPDSWVERVIDGDTLVATVTRDLGFHGTASFQVKLRLNRINAAPARTADGKAATAALSDLLVPPVRPPVLIETVGAYKYGDEWMAEITLPDGRNVSEVLVAAGHAVYWTGRGVRPDA